MFKEFVDCAKRYKETNEIIPDPDSDEYRSLALAAIDVFENICEPHGLMPDELHKKYPKSVVNALWAQLRATYNEVLDIEEGYRQQEIHHSWFDVIVIALEATALFLTNESDDDSLHNKFTAIVGRTPHEMLDIELPIILSKS